MKNHHSESRPFGLNSLIRLVFFVALLAIGIVLIINSLNSRQNDPTVLGAETNNLDLPAPIYAILSQASSSPAIISLQDQVIKFQKEKLNDFPQKQIKDLEKYVAKTILQRLIEFVDKQ